MSKLVCRTVLLTAIVALFAAAPAFAAQRYASPSGTGLASGGCPQIDPCSINNAVLNTYTNDGDEVILAAGDYTIGTSELDIMDAIDVHGLGLPSATHIIGTGNLPVYLGNAGATLRQVEISHSTGITFAALFVNQGTAANVIATSSSANGCMVSNATIRDSICTTSSDGRNGIHINFSGDPHTNVLRNVTAIGSGATNSYGVYAGASSGSVTSFDVKGLIASGTSADIFASGTTGGTSTVTLDHSNYQQVTSVGTATVTAAGTNNNQTAAPVFVNAATGDYHQDPTSPTIDAGAVDGSSGSTDIDGEARTIGSAPDIGADEIDNAAPDKPIFSQPTNGAVTSDTTPLVQGNAEDGSTVSVLLDGSTPVCSTTSSGGSFSCTAPTLAEGAHSLRATDTDAVGNVSAASDNVTVTIDVTAPVVAISSPAGGSTIGDNTPAPDFTVTDANPGASECSIDGGTFTGCSSGASLATLGDGGHTLSVRHTDAAGHAAMATTTFTVDATAPQTTIGKKPRARSTKRKAKITFSSSESGSTFMCRLDRGAFKSCNSPFSKRVKPGKHKLQVIAIDATGNRDPSPATYKWKVLVG